MDRGDPLAYCGGMAHRVGKRATVGLIPDEVWVLVLRQETAFVLHHTRCGVTRGRMCDCVPLFIGTGFGIDSVRASA